MIERSVGDIVIIELSGRFDAYEVPKLTEWFDGKPDAKNVVVNLAGVTFIDSSGLATLVKMLKRCRQNNGELGLSNLQQAVLIIMELTRLDKAFDIYDTEAEAIQAIEAKQPSS